MCFPYKIELEIQGDLQEALVHDLLDNAKKLFGSGMCFDAVENLHEQFKAAIEKHKALKHAKPKRKSRKKK